MESRFHSPNGREIFLFCKASRQVFEFTSRDQSGESGTDQLLPRLRCLEQYFHTLPRLHGLRLQVQGQIYLCTLPVLVRCASSTDMRRLKTGIRSEKCVVRRFRRSANVYLHKPRQYSIAYYTPRLYGIAYCS